MRRFALILLPLLLAVYASLRPYQETAEFVRNNPLASE